MIREKDTALSELEMTYLSSVMVTWEAVSLSPPPTPAILYRPFACIKHFIV